ncbi:hypothetical protein PORY_001427 [Pneumocystis oryctolagi]|uniref:Uncharacterized protein n=1 Tax=Pneumocystis oryctolagi TaxID=42067 RepID=A0ACB7CDV5_9ASCO|nr:hypothetical protein PORY_001427 [Pneumocystis oryctolagi]
MNEEETKPVEDNSGHLKARFSDSSVPPLPPGWTEHLAPTGHLYYFHRATKKSTYIRPSVDAVEARTNFIIPPPPPIPSDQPVIESNSSHVSNVPAQISFLNQLIRKKAPDRPKYRFPISNAKPWVRVVTRYKRQFVHNPETGVSLWIPPPQVLSAMIDEKKINNSLNNSSENFDQSLNESDSFDENSDDSDISDAFSSDSDGSSDSSNNTSSSAVPVVPDGTEYTEDDIAWQFAAMENNSFDTVPEINLTKDERIKKFKEMLQELDIDPYHPWDKEVLKIMEDPRYLLINTMKERKELFQTFCKEFIAQQKKEAESRPKRNPKISFITLLQDPRTPNMYWHEFRRKFKKEQEYKEFGLNDKEREKLFRAYQEQMKYDNKKKEEDFQTLLKTTTSVTKDTTLSSLPDEILSDLRYAVIPSEKLEEYINKYTQTLNV